MRTVCLKSVLGQIIQCQFRSKTFFLLRRLKISSCWWWQRQGGWNECSISLIINIDVLKTIQTVRWAESWCEPPTASNEEIPPPLRYKMLYKNERLGDKLLVQCPAHLKRQSEPQPKLGSRFHMIPYHMKYRNPKYFDEIRRQLFAIEFYVCWQPHVTSSLVICDTCFVQPSSHRFEKKLLWPKKSLNTAGLLLSGTQSSVWSVTTCWLTMTSRPDADFGFVFRGFLENYEVLANKILHRA